MSVEISFIESLPLTIQITEGLTIEDVCFQCCRWLQISPLARHLFALQIYESNYYVSPSDVLKHKHTVEKFNFRCRFWPSAENLSKIGTKALNYLFAQVKTDFVQGKIPAFNTKSSEALGLGVTAMYCYMQDHGAEINFVLNNYMKFLPKVVCKNCHLSVTQKPLKKKLKHVVDNPPELWLCKKEFLRTVMKIAPEYAQEIYPAQVCIEDGGVPQEYELIIQPLDREFPGVKLQSLRKKIPDQNVCGLDEICFISIRKEDLTIGISRINGVPQYIQMGSMELIKSCVSCLNGYYRLTEKWTFDLCSDLVTPSLIKLRSIKCHGPVGEEFAHHKLKHKRQNKPGTYIMREDQFHYDLLCLDVCLSDGERVRTVVIEKTPEGYSLQGYSGSCYALSDLLANIRQITGGDVDPKECLPSSENDVSDLLLCRQKPISLADMNGPGHRTMQALPVCLPPHSVQLYSGADGSSYEFQGRFTTVQRGVWNRSPQEQILIVRKLLKREFQASHSQPFLESVQRSMFWTCETVVRHYGIILDSPLSLIVEYLPLGPLDKYLQDHSEDLEVIDLVEAATNLAKALFYLGENDFVHGNIRCRNVMVASRTDRSIGVKLTDPGISSYTEEELPWIPIELYGSWKQVNRTSTSDIWAFGTTLWEIFSYGKKPCAGWSEVQITRLFRHSWRLPRPDNCLDEVYQIMLNTWAPDSHRRPKAQAILRDVNRILCDVVYNSRRPVYAKPRHSICESMTSMETEMTTLRAISSDHDNVSFDDSISNFDENRFTDPGMVSFLLPSATLNGGSSPSIDSEEDELANIYELRDREQLQLGQIIGRGHYGEVRMGVIKHEDGTEETVAVKTLKNCLINSPESTDLQRECFIMKSLSHPNIVEVKAILPETSTMLVMEYIPMGSLLNYLRSPNNAPITNRQLLKFATDVAEGMEYLFQKNIVHRDLAARNILVASEDTVKISDFGLARHVGGYGGYYQVRRNRQTLPIRWYAPESLACWKFSTKSDVWSYGVTLYEMFSRGEDPQYVSGVCDEHALLLQALQQGLRLPCPPQCPRILYRDLMQPCWHEEDNQRPSFQNILETLRGLEAQI